MERDAVLKINSLKKIAHGVIDTLLTRNSHISRINEFEVTQQWGLWPDRTLNPLTRNPARYWSQADEDSITLKIFSRLEIQKGTFIEIGCGDGLQNNTLVLLSQGWHGGWIDGIELSFKIPEDSRLKHKKAWVTTSNVVELIKATAPQDFENKLNFLSLDLDGNDYHLLKEVMQSDIAIDIIVLEYNARFPENSEWVMPYNEMHTWQDDDYFGASLFSFNKLLMSFEYTLVACSVQGSNAFFVHNRFISKFQDIPKSLGEIYQPPLYYLVHQWAQKASPVTVKQMLAKND